MSNYKRILAEAQKNLPQEEAVSDCLSSNIEALASIVNDAQNILRTMPSDENVKAHLTEQWLQGKIAEAQEHLEIIHDFVKFNRVEADDNITPASLWENIRKKKLREGKNYKPAKPGDKDRPNKDAWDRAKGEPSEKQKKALDKNKDGKITKEDFELLRKKK